MAAILSDPENTNRSAEQVADLVITALDDLRSKTHRLAVVGQIQNPGAPETHTVILGPYSTRGLLDSQEKFLRSLQGGSAARQAGQDLAWDTKIGKGRGRFMLVPAFARPRQAWDFYRTAGSMPARFENITRSLARWEAGLWATQADYGPVCHCGLATDREHQTGAGPVLTGPCPVHGGV